MARSVRSSGADYESNRAVSDTVAFVLMFAIIITGVGIVSLGAFDNLETFSDREQIESGERGLSAAAATIDNLHRQNDTRRSFSLALGGGQVYLNNTDIDIEIRDSFGTTIRDPTYAINATEHRFDRSPEDVIVAYEGGAVFRNPGFGARYEPSVRCKADSTAILSFVKLETASGSGINIGTGTDEPTVLNPRGLPGESPVADLDDTLLFSAEAGQQEVLIERGSDLTVAVDVTDTGNPEQWGHYFEGRDGWQQNPSNPTEYECENVDTALVRVTTVELSL